MFKWADSSSVTNTVDAVEPPSKSNPADARPSLTVSGYHYTPTPAVKEDIMSTIRTLLTDIGKEHHATVYDATVLALSRGRELSSLTQVLLGLGIKSITQRRAGNISLLLCNRAQTISTKERYLQTGITEAIWRHSGAPCHADTAGVNGPLGPADYSRTRDQAIAHEAANGKVYCITEGMFLNGKWTLPAREEGCGCFSSPLLPVLSKITGYIVAEPNESPEERAVRFEKISTFVAKKEADAKLANAESHAALLAEYAEKYRVVREECLKERASAKAEARKKARKSKIPKKTE